MLLLKLAYGLHPWVGLASSIWLFSTTLATRGLTIAGMEIALLLARGDLLKARQKVGWIVGRDTDTMDEADICRAAVETVAENTSDADTRMRDTWTSDGLRLNWMILPT